MEIFVHHEGQQFRPRSLDAIFVQTRQAVASRPNETQDQPRAAEASMVDAKAAPAISAAFVAPFITRMESVAGLG
jgi:hypothetical protein